MYFEGPRSGNTGETMKRYWLFGWDFYYPSGGMDDFIEAFETLEEAKEAQLKWAARRDATDILDALTVLEGRYDR